MGDEWGGDLLGDEEAERAMMINTALTHAAMYGRLRDVKRLFATGATKHRFVQDAFLIAAMNGRLCTARWLFAYGATDFDLDDAIRTVAHRGHVGVVKWLATNGATDLDEAMRIAALNGHLNVVKWFAANGATDLDQAMGGAAGKGHLDVVKWLAANGATDFQEAMFWPAVNGRLDVLKWLAANGATHLDDVIEAAAVNGHLDTVKWLAANGATANLGAAASKAEECDEHDVARWLNAFRGLQTFKKAVRAWILINFWTKEVGKSQYAPGCSGAKRCCDEFEEFNGRLPEKVVTEAFGELGVLSETKGKRPRLAKCHSPAAVTFDCGDCGQCVIDCVDCNALVCTGCDEDWGCDA